MRSHRRHHAPTSVLLILLGIPMLMVYSVMKGCNEPRAVTSPPVVHHAAPAAAKAQARHWDI